MMINVAIVDDDMIFLNMIRERILNLNNNLNVICFSNPSDFIKSINDVDYVLLDIELPQIDGISLSKQLRNNNISIFFITIHEELMIRAFGKNVEGFILKNDLENGIHNFLQHIFNKRKECFLKVRIYDKVMKIYFDEIIYISYLLRDVEFHLINGSKIIQKNTNLKDICIQLNDDFALVNRNTIINLKYVNKFDHNYIYIQNKKINVSRRKVKEIKIKLFERMLSSGD